MRIFWKYIDTYTIYIYERDIETESERCIYTSINGTRVDEWEPWDFDTIEEEKTSSSSIAIHH